MTPNERRLTPRTAKRAMPAVRNSETGFSLAVSDTHSGSGKDHKPADAW